MLISQIFRNFAHNEETYIYYMDTQNTPVHVRLWHLDFWLLSLANLSLTVMVYMLMPFLPSHLAACHGIIPMEIGLIFISYAAGLYLLGGFTSYLVQRYRRNRVCLWSIALLVLAVSQLYFNEHLPVGHDVTVALAIVVAVVVGALYGLSKMILMSTLVIDSCESFMRTEANYSATWFGRMALAIGPAVGLCCHGLMGFRPAILVSCGLGLTAIVSILMAHFPFKAPEDNVRLWSADRFFLVRGLPLFLVLFMMTAVVGAVFSTGKDAGFYAFMLLGFVLALLAEKFVFVDADLKSAAVTGLICIYAAVIMIMTSRLTVVEAVIPVLLAFGIALIGTRFLLFFIKLSRHCQRGTSQSTFLLGWESGLAAGLALGYGVLERNAYAVCITSLSLAVVAMFVYNNFLHQWYMEHRNR